MRASTKAGVEARPSPCYRSKNQPTFACVAMEVGMLEEAVLAIHLICGGGGQQISRDTATAVRNSDYSDTVSIDRTVRSDFDDEVAIEIIGTEGRMRVPGAIKPKLRSGGEDGWWKLKNLRISPDEIRAK